MARARTKRSKANEEDDEQQGPRRRPLWSGAVSFGIVTIPVRLFAAVRDHALHAHQISRTDRKRIRYLKVADGTTDEVPASEIVKGYQIAGGRYVVFDDEELDRLAARKTKLIEIDAFVPLAEIDPRFFDRPYYLFPTDDAADKPYRLLIEALERSERVGIAQMVMHGKEHLVAIRTLDGILALETLHFADELVEPEQLQRLRRKPKLAERELGMADQLVASMSTEFKPEAYHDEYRKRLSEAIKRKAKGKVITLEEPEAEESDGKTIDLMEALRQSVQRSRRRKSAPTPRKRKKAS